MTQSWARRRWIFPLTPVACLALGACDVVGFTDAKEPVGQVVALINGEEITVLELRAELAGQNVSDPAAAKAAEQAALQAIIGRKILANEARERGLDSTPEFALQKLRALDALLVQTLQARIAADVPPPTREEAERFVTSNPDIFAQRKIFVVDQIHMLRPTDPGMMREFEPLRTLEEVERHLVEKNITYRRAANGVIDAVSTDPRLVQRIVALPPGEVFAMSANDGVLFNRIRETRVVPYAGEPAITYALDLLRRQRIQETVAKEFNAIRARSTNSIRYNSVYRPETPADNKAPASVPGGGPGNGG